MRWTCLFLVALAGLCPHPAAAQYKQDPVDQKLNRQRQIAIRYAKSPSGDPAERKNFDDYLTRYYFPAMTRTDETSLGELGDLRFDLFSQFIWPADASLQSDLTAKAYAYSMNVIKGFREYHPAVVYNAVLILGGLDKTYAIEKGANQRPAVPLPEANARLAQIVGLGLKGTFSPSMLAGALVGLERHSRAFAGLDRDGKRQTFAALLAVLKQEDFPPEVNREVRGWLRMRAAEGLANIGVAGGGALEAMTAMIANDDLHLDNRSRIAALLGQESFKLPEGAASLAAAEAVVALASDVAKYERDEANEFEDLQAGVVRSGGPVISSSRFEVDPLEGFLTYNRGALIAQLMHLKDSLTALAPVAGPRSEALTQMAAATDKLINVAKDPRGTQDLDVTLEIDRWAAEIRQLAKPAGAEPEEAIAPL
ncbi:hypothetical protein [Pirellulimonas nuda]|nr:hypothetical protein [Pirellulimonas nuda]